MAELDGNKQRVVGYENHVGRTNLGPDASPLGTVLSGHGNDGSSAVEGAVQRRVVGTYLHGPLLPKNPWVADTLLAWALEHAGADSSLEELDDSLATTAHAVAVGRAGMAR